METAPVESALLRRAQSGDQRAFALVIDGCYNQVFRFALNYCGQRQDAEDITQQACIKLAKNLSSFRFESAFNTWLYRLVINCAKDWYRQQNRFHSDDSQKVCEEANTEGESLVYLQQVLQLVADMGDDFRETLVLVAGEGFNHREAGGLLGIKESTVSWRMHQIRKRLSALQVEEKFR